MEEDGEQQTIQVSKVETRVRSFDCNDVLVGEVITTVVHYEPVSGEIYGTGMYL